MAASSKQPFEITDFSGGISDNVFSQELNTADEMDNFYVTPDNRLLSRPGSALDDALHSPVPSGNQRIGALINYARNDKLFRQAARNIYYRPNADETGTYTTLLGPSGNQVFTAGTTANFCSHSEWNRQTFLVNDAFANPMKVYKNASNQYVVRNIGLPALASNPTVTPGLLGGTRSYVYAFIYTYVYQVGVQSFEEIGPTTLVEVPISGDPSVNPNLISAIPVLANTGGNNYDTTNIHVEIYRTINNGVTFYKVGFVSNGTTTFSDSVSDDTLQANAELYTNDGTLDYYPAPSSKFVHIVGNVGYYGYTKDTDGEHPYRVSQSVPGNPGFVPKITWVDVEDEVKGLKSVRNLPILLCNRHVYRLDGTFDAQGRGGMQAVKIHNSAGCLSNDSCVEAENFLFWAGIDGFYATDGYQVTKISDHLNQTYSAIKAASSNLLRIQGKYDETNRRIFWAVQRDASSLENDTLFVLHLRYGVNPKSTFTTWSGKSFKPTAIEIFNSSLYRADNLGYVFKHDDAVLTDKKIDTGKDPVNWAKETIIWLYRSNQLNFGNTFFRKFVSRILLQAANAGNTTIQITAINDQGRKTRNLKIIRWRRNVVWGDPSFVWRNIDCIWDAEGLIEQWRRFPAGGLRLSYLQLEITNGLGIIAASDSDGLCTLNKTAKTALLPGLWPDDSVDYYLSFANDNYVKKYQVASINNSKDTVTLIDSANTLPADGTYEWELFGYAKGEPLNLLGYNLHWEHVDQNQQTFQAGDDGGN